MTFQPNEKTFANRRIKTKKIFEQKNRNKYNTLSKISFIKDINFTWNTQKQIRGGVIIYTFIENNIFFCLGVDALTKDLCDFGGGISKRIDVNPISGAIREFSEETLHVFGDFSCNELENQIVLYNNKMLIIFLHLHIDSIDKVNEEFSYRLSKEIHPETSALAWIDLNEFTKILNNKGRRIYSKIRNFIMEKPSVLLELLNEMGIILES